MWYSIYVLRITKKTKFLSSKVTVFGQCICIQCSRGECKGKTYIKVLRSFAMTVNVGPPTW